jgi:hypothetical protein
MSGEEGGTPSGFRQLTAGDRKSFRLLLASRLRFLAATMLMLRKGGRFTDTQIQKYFLCAIVSFGVAAFAIFAIAHIKIPLVGLIAVAVAIAAFKKNFNRWGNWFVGKRGEEAVTEALKHGLPYDYVLLNDLVLPNGRGNVDHLVIGPNGLFLIETKNYSGRIKCFGDKWYINGRPSKSVSRQAKRNAMVVKDHLKEVFGAQRMRLPYVNSIVVFVKPNGRLNLNGPTVPVLRLEELAGFIAGYQSRTEMPKETIRAIVHHMHSLQHQSGEIVQPVRVASR